MANEQIIDALVVAISRKIERFMIDLEYSFDDAKERCKRESCAGSLVWEIIDRKYGQPS